MAVQFEKRCHQEKRRVEPRSETYRAASIAVVNALS